MSSRLIILPGSSADAPPSSEYDVNLRPDGKGNDGRTAGGALMLPARSRITVAYTAGRQAANAGETMVASGPRSEVLDVLREAGYAVAAESDSEQVRAQLGAIVNELDVRAEETANGVFMVTPISHRAREAAKSWHASAADPAMTERLSAALGETILGNDGTQENSVTVIEDAAQDPEGGVHLQIQLRGARASEALNEVAAAEGVSRTEAIELTVITSIAVRELTSR